MKLLSAGPSPFVAHAAMAAKFAGIDVETVVVDSNSGDPVLDAANPLGKIPCLITDDGVGVYDSRAITRYLDRVSGGKLFPSSSEALLQAERMEAHCMGLNDVLVGYMYELRFRPEEKVHQPWLDRLWTKAERGLDVLPGGLPPNDGNVHIGSIALASTLGYLALRFAGKWESDRDALLTWDEAFDAAHPALSALKPRS